MHDSKLDKGVCVSNSLILALSTIFKTFKKEKEKGKPKDTMHVIRSFQRIYKEYN